MAGLPTISSQDMAIADYAKDLGYRILPNGQGDIQITHSLDENDIAAMQASACFVVLADGTAKTHGNLRSDQGKREQPFMPIVDEVDGNPPAPMEMRCE